MKITIPTQTYCVPSPRQLKAIRSWLGINSIDFAKESGIGQSTLIDYEAQRRDTISTQVHQAIAIAVHKRGIVFNRQGHVVLPG